MHAGPQKIKGEKKNVFGSDAGGPYRKTSPWSSLHRLISFYRMQALSLGAKDVINLLGKLPVVLTRYAVIPQASGLIPRAVLGRASFLFVFHELSWGGRVSSSCSTSCPGEGELPLRVPRAVLGRARFPLRVPRAVLGRASFLFMFHELSWGGRVTSSYSTSCPGEGELPLRIPRAALGRASFLFMFHELSAVLGRASFLFVFHELPWGGRVTSSCSTSCPGEGELLLRIPRAALGRASYLFVFHELSWGGRVSSSCSTS